MDGILLYIIGAILCLVVVSGRRPRAVEGGGSSDRWLECITTLPLPSQQSWHYCWIMCRIPGKGGNPCKILFSLFIQLIEWYFSLQLIPPICMSYFEITVLNLLLISFVHSFCIVSILFDYWYLYNIIVVNLRVQRAFPKGKPTANTPHSHILLWNYGSPSIANIFHSLF